MLRYHVAFYLPATAGEMVVAEALDFPGAVTQGFDLADARVMIASAMEDLARRCRSGRTRAVDRSRRGYADLKRHELLQHLKRQGCIVDREGGRHTICDNPATGAEAPVPRHAEIDNRLARKIWEQLGIMPIR